MQPFDRGLLSLYTFVLTILFILAIPFLGGWVEREAFAPLYNLRMEQPESIFIVLGLFILVGARLFWVGVRPARKHLIIHEGALGQVRITLTAIEDLVEKVVSQNSGIREAKARVLALPQGVGISVQAMVTPDVQIPELSKIIQGQVNEKILEVTGITVQQVHVFVNSISARKPRVE